MKVSDFTFDLPEELIAQDPLEDRSSSRLLTLDKKEYLKYKDKLNNIHIIGKVNNSDKITLISQKSVKTMKITGYEHLKEN